MGLEASSSGLIRPTRPHCFDPLWDGPVIEHGTQKEHVGRRHPEDARRVAQQGPASSMCDVRIESEQNPLRRSGDAEAVVVTPWDPRDAKSGVHEEVRR